MEALAVLALAGCTRVRPRSRRESPIYSRIANTPFPENYATKESAAKLSNELFLSEGCSRICGHSLPSTSVHPGSLRRNLRQGLQRTSYLEAAVQRQDPSDYSQLRSDLRHALTDGALAPYSLTFAFEVLELLLYPGEVSHCPLLSQKTSIPQSLYSSLASLCI